MTKISIYINILMNYIKNFLIFIILSLSQAQAEIGGDFTLRDFNNNKYHLYSSSKEKVIFFWLSQLPRYLSNNPF